MAWNCKSKRKQIHKGFRPIVSEPGRKLNAAWCFSKSRIFSAYQLFPRDPFSVFFSKMRSGKHSHRKPAATKLSNDQLRRHFFSWSNLEKWRQIYKQFIFTYLLTYGWLFNLCTEFAIYQSQEFDHEIQVDVLDQNLKVKKWPFHYGWFLFWDPTKKKTVSVACL